MPMYTFVFALPAGYVSEDIIPKREALPITTDEDTARRMIPVSTPPLPILRCEECGALVSGDSYSQTTHNYWHDSLNRALNDPRTVKLT